MANIKDLIGEAYREDMTKEELIEALNGVQLPKDNSDEIDRLKNAVSKANAESADYKRKLKDRLSEEEKKSAEEAERISAIENENKELRKKITVSEYTAKFLASGLEEKVAIASAEAAFNGDIDTVIANYNSKIASIRDSVKAELISSTPVMSGGNSTIVKDFTEDITRSWADGDPGTAAALMRLSQTQNMNE